MLLHRNSKQMVALISGYLLFFACRSTTPGTTASGVAVPDSTPYLVVLGIAQDAGFPQANCQKECCVPAWTDPGRRRFVSCLGLVDPKSGSRWLFDATPDFPDQLHLLDTLDPRTAGTISGIFLTHAHIGHYTGLMHLGREAMGAQQIPVYAMPRMDTFLRTNGPWDQLVRLENIQLESLNAGVPVVLNEKIQVRPILVPHRDEYSETVGFYLITSQKKILYIPDIDKWNRWDQHLPALLEDVDLAFLDGTFFANGEIPNRDMSEIPHPFIMETIDLLSDLPAESKQKIYFIHLNHTNPTLQPGSSARQTVQAAGMHLATQGQIINLGDSFQ